MHYTNNIITSCRDCWKQKAFWRGYLLHTRAQKITCQCFWLNAPVIIRAEVWTNTAIYSRALLRIHIIGGQRSVWIAPPSLPPHHSGPATRDYQILCCCLITFIFTSNFINAMQVSPQNKIIPEHSTSLLSSVLLRVCRLFCMCELSKDGCTKRRNIQWVSTCCMDKASHLTAFCTWDSTPHLPVTPAQLMRPGIGRNVTSHNILPYYFSVSNFFTKLLTNNILHSHYVVRWLFMHVIH